MRSRQPGSVRRGATFAGGGPAHARGYSSKRSGGPGSSSAEGRPALPGVTEGSLAGSDLSISSLSVNFFRLSSVTRKLRRVAREAGDKDDPCVVELECVGPDRRRGRYRWRGRVWKGGAVADWSLVQLQQPIHLWFAAGGLLGLGRVRQ